MKFSPEKQSYLSHQLVNRLLSKKLVQVSSKEDLFEVVKKGIQNFVKEWDDLNQEIKKKIQNIKRGVKEGSSEWDVLYRRFFEEEFRKKSSLFYKK
ncbi:MAG: DUF507 family protein [Bdellovibrionales bacterium]|nr:DUF507 family protein [Bdellovibrionales bacterium]